MLKYRLTNDTKEATVAVVLGGDGSLLRANALFPNKTPLVMGFKMGTLNFMMPFDFKEYKSVITTIESFEIMKRERFSVSVNDKVIGTALNDVVISRMNTQLLGLSISVGTRFKMSMLNEMNADGLICSTPSGSTAYNLSAGGPLVHPMIQATTITPICPQTLSFRPLLIPFYRNKEKVIIKINCTDPFKLSLDGLEMDLTDKDTVKLCKSEHPLNCLYPSHSSWISDISKLVGWNRGRFSKLVNH